MGATARQIPVTPDDIAGNGGGAYAELEVPGDYEIVLGSVEDYDYTAKGKGAGWIFIYNVETPSGGTVPMKTWVSFSPGARWKLVQILEAHGFDVDEGINTVDPNAFVGEAIGGHIDFPRNDEGVPTNKYREVQEFFALAEEPVEEEAPVPQVVERIAAAAAVPVAHDPERDGEQF